MREVGEDPLDEHEHIYFLFYQLEGGDDFNKLVGFDVFIFFYLIEDGVEVGDLYSCVLVLTVFDFVLYLFALAVVEDLDDQLGKGHSRDKLADFGGGYAEGLEGGEGGRR